MFVFQDSSILRKKANGRYCIRTKLFYFSGTGNSLKVARNLAGELGGAEVIPVSMAIGGEADIDAECIGLVFPVYAWGLPLIVAEFCRKFVVRQSAYIFAVATYGGFPAGALVQLKKLLKQKGLKLAAGFGVLMPGNYTPLYGAIPEDKQQEMFTEEKKRVQEIVEMVKIKKQGEIKSGNFLVNLILSGLIYRLFLFRVHGGDRFFRVNDKCDGCGICQKICPVVNIEMRSGKPAWQHKCEQCMACLQWCPQEAIQFGRKTEGRKRYRHPECVARDFMLQE